MPRLRNTRTGVIVNVDEATAESLRATHKPVEAVRPPRPTAGKPSK